MKNRLELKKQLYKHCFDFVEARFATIQNQIQAIQESLSSETKSSAGDKHETGRAMLQLEREKSGQQLVEVEKLKTALSKIEVETSREIIGLGSAVFTTQANYFISISAGQIDLGSDKFYAISPNTPMGLLLMGKKVGHEVTFSGQHFTIITVV